MRSLYRVSIAFAFVSFLALPAFAQEDIDSFLEKNVDDGKKLIGAYVEPVMKGLSLSLDQGWYNTAKPHKIAGVDLTITVNAITIPDNKLLFRPDKLGL